MVMLRAARVWTLALVMMGVLASSSGTVKEARADDPEKRERPDYDGRHSDKRGDGLLWVPRIVASPLYLTSEYLIRKPIGALVKTAEENHWAEGLMNFFTFDKDHKVGVLPTFLVEFAFRPSVGLYFFWDDFLVKKNAFRVHGSTGGVGWYSISVTDRVTLADGLSSIAARAAWVRRSDYVFYGFGPRTPEVDRTRYSADIADFNFKYIANLWRSSELIAIAGVRDARFAGDGGCCHDPTLDEREAVGDPPPKPPGFNDGYTSIYQRLEVAFDNRNPAPADGSGVRLEVIGEHGSDTKNSSHASWVKYGGTAGAFLDLNGRQRVLSLQLTMLFADPLKGDIPFTEQIVLGGIGPMRGFRPGRLIDRSAAVATLQYQWPVWVFLDGFLHLAAGNVYGEHLSGFDLKLTRLSTGIGFRSSSSRDQMFEILFALGTEPLDQGLRFTAKRFLIGATRGF